MPHALTSTAVVLTALLAIAGAKVVRSVEPLAARPTLEQARHQAEVVHTTLHATLQAVHHRYYREDAGQPTAIAMPMVIRGSSVPS